MRIEASHINENNNTINTVHSINKFSLKENNNKFFS